MKRLFCVKNSKGKIIEWETGAYFDNKQDAKEFRNHVPGAHVSRGPDHIGKHGHKVARMRRQPKHNQE